MWVYCSGRTSTAWGTGFTSDLTRAGTTVWVKSGGFGFGVKIRNVKLLSYHISTYVIITGKNVFTFFFLYINCRCPVSIFTEVRTHVQFLLRDSDMVSPHNAVAKSAFNISVLSISSYKNGLDS